MSSMPKANQLLRTSQYSREFAHQFRGYHVHGSIRMTPIAIPAPSSMLMPKESRPKTVKSPFNFGGDINIRFSSLSKSTLEILSSPLPCKLMFLSFQLASEYCRQRRQTGPHSQHQEEEQMELEPHHDQYDPSVTRECVL